MKDMLIVLALAYIGLGALFAVACLSLGLARVDPAAQRSGLAFKLAIIPGLAMLWPVMLGKWCCA